MSTENLKAVITGDASGMDKASKQATAALDKISAAAASFDKRARDLNLQINYGAKATENLGNTAASAARKVEVTTREMTRSSEAMRAMNKSSSSATNSLFALSGIVQDAPYGFRAIANNITFFTQEMAYSAKAAGGFGAAIKAMGSAFLGPAGIIIAISAVVSLLDVFFGSSSKAADGISALDDGITTLSESLLSGAKDALKQSVNLDILYNAATNANKSMTERLAAVKELQSKYPSYLGNESKEAILTGNAADAYKRLKDQILATARARAAEKGIEANASKQLDIEAKEIDLTAKLNELKLKQKKLASNAEATSGLNALSATGGIAAGAMETLSSKINAVNKQLKDLHKQHDQIDQDSQRLKDAINVKDLIDKPKPNPGGDGTGGNLKTIAGVLAEVQTKFEQVDTLAKGLGQSEEQIATAKIKILYNYLDDIARIGGPGAVDALRQMVAEADKIQSSAFLPVFTGGKFGVTTPGGISGNPGVPTHIGGAPAGIAIGNPAKLAKEQAQAYREAMQPLLQQGRQLDNIFKNVFSTIANGGNAFQAMAQMVEQLIVKLAAAAAAAAILTALTGGSFTAAAGVAGSFKSIFGGLSGIPFGGSHATGGYIPTPQLAVVGDAPGGEWVLNQKQISAILNGTGGGREVNVTGRIEAEGSTLAVVINNANKKTGRRN